MFRRIWVAILFFFIFIVVINILQFFVNSPTSNLFLGLLKGLVALLLLVLGIVLFPIMYLLNAIPPYGLTIYIIIGILFVTSLIVDITLLYFEGKAKARKIEQEREIEKKRKIDLEKSDYHNNMKYLIDTANDYAEHIGIFSSGIHECIPYADAALDRALKEFAGNYYAPFWDEIEYATTELARYNFSLETINRYMIDYRNTVKEIDDEYKDQLLKCELPGDLPDPKKTTARLNEIVRNAQKNYEFSSIYEQRKTNSIMTHGFTNLGDAINTMSFKLSESLSELAENINQSTNEILISTSEYADVIRGQADMIDQNMKNQISEQKKYNELSKRQNDILSKQDKKLDNIQRKRKPGLFDD